MPPTDRPGRGPAARRLALAVALALCALAVDLAGAAFRARLADWSGRIGEIRAWLAGYERERRTLDSAYDSLPDERQVLEVFDDAIRRARDAGVALAGMRSLAVEGEGRLAALRIEATARGSYANLRAFLRALESMPLPFHVESVEHTAAAAAPGELSLVVTAAALHRRPR